MSKAPRISWYLDTRRVLQSGGFPLKLRVTFVRLNSAGKKWDQHYFNTGLSYSKEAYKKLSGRKTIFSLSNDKKKINDFERKAADIIDANPFISPDLFKSLFTGEYVQAANLVDLFTEKINNLNKAGKISTAQSYESALASFKQYTDVLNLHAVDVSWLKGYEHHMLSAGMSVSTIGIYLRNLRSVFNIAITRNLISRDLYPFGSKQYQIPTSNNFKKALTQKHKTKLLNHKPTDANLAKALDYWRFSYYCNGMNFTDIAWLTDENIVDGVLYYIRRKTRQTDRKQTHLAIPLRKEALHILKKHGTHKPYLFGIIKPEMTPRQIRFAIMDFIRFTNRGVKTIAAKLQLPGKVTTYTARHTVATTLLEAGADLRDIKETFGHSSFTTTERYVASLDMAKKKKLVDLL